MKKIIISTILLLSFLGGANAQTYVKFDENGLMNNANAFGALLCPLNKEKVAEVLKAAIALDIPKKHINGYCEVRAEFLCKKLSPIVYGSNCEIGKIWAFAPSIYTLTWNKKLTTKDPLFSGENIDWDYHVAPIFAIQNGSKIDTVVIDFSIKDKAFINYREWLTKLNCKEAIYTFTDDSYYLFYTLDGLTLTGAKYNGYTTPTNLPKIITGHFWYLAATDTTSVPSGLSYNELAIHLVEKYYTNTTYSQYKDQIKSATKLYEMKKLIDGTLIGLPPELLAECTKYYKERLGYWTKQYK
jgi:Glutaminase